MDVLLILALSLAGSGENISIIDNRVELEKKCNGETEVSIAGNHNKVVLRGECKLVTVGGNHNTVTIERARAVQLLGNDNRAEVRASGKIELLGNRNTVRYWKGLEEKKEPRITRLGQKNQVIREK